MHIAELIALAKVRSGKTQTVMAQEMGHKVKTRISQIGSGRLKADASEIVYLAEAAKMPPIKVLAEIESERHPELAKIWTMILQKGEMALIKYRDMFYPSKNSIFIERRSAPRQANA